MILDFLFLLISRERKELREIRWCQNDHLCEEKGFFGLQDFFNFWQYPWNENSYQRCNGVKTTRFLRAFTIFCVSHTTWENIVGENTSAGIWICWICISISVPHIPWYKFSISVPHTPWDNSHRWRCPSTRRPPQLQTDPACEQGHIILFLPVHTIKAIYQIMSRHSLEKPSFVFSTLVDKSRPVLNYNILLSHSPWHWTVHLSLKGIKARKLEAGEPSGYKKKTSVAF